METKVNYTAIGATVLGLFAFFMVFLIWLGGVGFQTSTKEIEIIFSSVSGLKEGSPVKYQGLQVGEVKDIKINPQNPNQISVIVSINSETPIKKDVLAAVEPQGITGTSIIQLSGGSTEAPEIRLEKGFKYPRLYGKASQIDKVLSSAPNVIGDIGELTSDLKQVVNEENREAFRDILNNIKDLTESLKSGKDGAAGGDFGEVLKGLKSAIKEVELAAREIRYVFAENRDSLKSFGGVGLTALTKFLTEGKDTLATFKRVAEALERSPARFLRNDPDQGVRLR